jgi:hypothetical protein
MSTDRGWGCQDFRIFAVSTLLFGNTQIAAISFLFHDGREASVATGAKPWPRSAQGAYRSNVCVAVLQRNVEETDLLFHVISAGWPADGVPLLAGEIGVVADTGPPNTAWEPGRATASEWLPKISWPVSIHVGPSLRVKSSGIVGMASAGLGAATSREFLRRGGPARDSA